MYDLNLLIRAHVDLSTPITPALHRSAPVTLGEINRAAVDKAVRTTRSCTVAR